MSKRSWIKFMIGKVEEFNLDFFDIVDCFYGFRYLSMVMLYEKIISRKYFT